MKMYEGLIPPCGIYCGGCPRYGRANGCVGAELQCRKCKGIYECCIGKKHLNFCFECTSFPCYKFNQFSKRWEKYGQNLIENQRHIKEQGIDSFLKFYQRKI